MPGTSWGRGVLSPGTWKLGLRAHSINLALAPAPALAPAMPGGRLSLAWPPCACQARPRRAAPEKGTDGSAAGGTSSGSTDGGVTLRRLERLALKPEALSTDSCLQSLNHLWPRGEGRSTANGQDARRDREGSL